MELYGIQGLLKGLEDLEQLADEWKQLTVWKRCVMLNRIVSVR